MPPESTKEKGAFKENGDCKELKAFRVRKECLASKDRRESKENEETAEL